MARVIREERRRRGFFGWIFLLIFWGWNAFMIYALVGGLANVSNQAQPTTEAGRAGQAIGVTIGAGMIIALWVAGAVIFGLMALFTRGRAYTVEVAPASVARADDIDTGEFSRQERLDFERGRKRQNPPALVEPPRKSARPVALKRNRGEQIEIVGESFFQDAIREAVRDAEDADGVYIVQLVVEAEPDNAHDPDAVRVAWRGHTVGYLPRKLTAAWHKAMGAASGACYGAVYTVAPDDDQLDDPNWQPKYGIWLSIAWPPSPA